MPTYEAIVNVTRVTQYRQLITATNPKLARQSLDDQMDDDGIESMTEVETTTTLTRVESCEPVKTNTVAEMFQALLGSALGNDVPEISVDSPCGKDCSGAIFAAAALLKHQRAATGKDSRATREITDIARETVATYISG